VRRTRVALSVAVAALAAGSVAIGTPASAAPGDVDLQLLALSDFHGRIAPQSGGDGTLTAGPGPGPGAGPGLPAAGSHTGELSALAGFLLLSGAGACVVGRRRRRGVVLAD